ncbi:hypothetical protein PSTT_15489 [Puccinia striiformis]|uniref:Myb/SANT-like domain-containing protein n=1 Tax=Puccinia striiformis TaxID=27350 RepID=A0A2S4UHC7_9BASI|nr:hypothetical protein PSTT_15489 [Puccinia striiformis]
MSPCEPNNIISLIDPAFLPVGIPVPTSETLPAEPAPMAASKKQKSKRNVPKKQPVPKKPAATKKAVSQLKKATLLELLAEQTLAGLATDTSGLKKEGWTTIAQKMNARYNLGFTVTTIKNRKNLLRQHFSDYQFLCAQSGFGWDGDQATVIADKSVWDKIFAAHPRREFNRLMDKPFPLYNLAYSVFNGRSASGEMVASERVPITTTAIKVTPASKRKAAVDNDNDSEIKVDPTSSVTLASTKHIHESKNLVIEKEMEGIQGAFIDCIRKL